MVYSKFLDKLGDFLLLTADLRSGLFVFIFFFFRFIFISIFLEFVGFFIKLLRCWTSAFFSFISKFIFFFISKFIFSFISKFFSIEFLFINALGNKINNSFLLLSFVFGLWLFILKFLACFLISFFWKIHFLILF